MKTMQHFMLLCLIAAISSVIFVFPEDYHGVTGTYYQYSVRHEEGMSPLFPFMGVQNESVNSANGNLFFTIPLVSRPGRNGLGIDLKLAYNSKIWDFYVDGGTLYATIAEKDSWVGVGWTFMVARIIDDSANGKPSWVKLFTRSLPPMLTIRYLQCC
jgi:hypothetical protein